MRFFLPPAATALILAPACVTLAPTTARAQERDPVLFVHGYGGSADDWETMINDFTDDGWNRDALYALDYDSDASNVQTAELIEQEVSGSSTRPVMTRWTWSPIPWADCPPAGT